MRANLRLSFPRKRESSVVVIGSKHWTPAFAGVTEKQ